MLNKVMRTEYVNIDSELILKVYNTCGILYLVHICNYIVDEGINHHIWHMTLAYRPTRVWQHRSFIYQLDIGVLYICISISAIISPYILLKEFTVGNYLSYMPYEVDMCMYFEVRSFIYQTKLDQHNLGVLCQKQVSSAGKVINSDSICGDVITCPCPWYPLTAIK